jgi:hypothetical protein
MIAKTIDFLLRRDTNSPGSQIKPHQESNAELIIGYFGRAPVSLLWDNEYRDRCFLVIAPRSRSTLRLSFFTRDITTLREALSQLREDLGQELA